MPMTGVFRGGKAFFKAAWWTMQKPAWLIVGILLLPALVQALEQWELVAELVSAFFWFLFGSYWRLVERIYTKVQEAVLYACLSSRFARIICDCTVEIGNRINIFRSLTGGGRPVFTKQVVRLEDFWETHKRLPMMLDEYRKWCYNYEGFLEGHVNKPLCATMVRLNRIRVPELVYDLDKILLVLIVLATGCGIVCGIIILRNWLRNKREAEELRELLQKERELENTLDEIFESGVSGSNPVPLKLHPKFLVEIVVLFEGKVRHVGMGFKYGGFIVTAQHVVLLAQGFGEPMIRFNDKTYEVDFFPRGDDVAIAIAPSVEGLASCKMAKIESKRVVACATNGTSFTMGTVTDAGEEIGFGRVAYDGTTAAGWSGSPYYVNNIVYGMHTNGGKVNFGLDASYILTLLKKGAESRFVTREDLEKETDKDNILEASADWLMEQLTKKGKKLRFQRNLDEVRVFDGQQYHVFDRDEFDEVYDMYLADQEDQYYREREEDYLEERHERRTGKRYEEDHFLDRDYDGDYVDQTDTFQCACNLEAEMPHADDPQPKNGMSPALAGVNACVLEGKKAFASKKGSRTSRLTRKSKRNSRKPLNLEYPESTHVPLRVRLESTRLIQRLRAENPRPKQESVESACSGKNSTTADSVLPTTSTRVLIEDLDERCEESILDRRLAIAI